MGREERETVARRVRELLIEARKSADLTQGQLAERIGRTQSFVSNYERGGRRIEVADFLVIARALGQDPQEMLGRVE